MNINKEMLLYVFSICLLSPVAKSADLKFVGIEVPPWAFKTNKEQKYTGIFPDIVAHLEKVSGHNIDITLSPYARITRELETGRQDCTVLILDENRKKTTIQGEYLFDLSIGVIPKESISLNSYSDLKDINISLLRGAAISHKFNNDEELKKEFDTDYMMSLRKLEYGRVDAIAGVIPTINYLAKKSGLDNSLGKPLNLSFEPVYLQCSEKLKNSGIIDDINKAIINLREKGAFDEIRKKYF